MIDGAREEKLMDAANLLLDARRTCVSMEDLPADLQPVSVDEAYLVQDAIAAAYGEIGGWKVGAATPESTPVFAPMPRNWIAKSGSVLEGPTWRYRGLEAEIAFLMGRDLLPRPTPYTREEIIEAIASCHPAIEVLESGLADPMKATRLSMIGDLQMHGGFIYGAACVGWRNIDFEDERVMLAVDGVVRVDRTGSNTSGDLLGLLPWLANHAGARTGGIRAGQWITTGSWTGNIQTVADTSVDVHFANAGQVSVRFG